MTTSHEQDIGTEWAQLEIPGMTIVRIKAEYSVDLTESHCGYWLRRIEGEKGQMTAALGAQCRPLSSFPENLNEMRDNIFMLLKDFVPPF